MTENNTDSRAQEQCFICGYHNPHGLHEHHIVPQAHGGSDEPENTVFLCGSCHQALHKLYDTNALERLIDNHTSGKVDEFSEPVGVELPDEQSVDRELPQDSRHLTWEDFCLTISLSAVEESLSRWRSDLGPDETNFFKGNRDYIIATIEAEEERAREHLSEYDFGYLVVPDDRLRQPHIRFVEGPADTYVTGKHVDGETTEKRERDVAWKGSYQRLHCGYCHYAFAETQQSDLARHLRLRHGVDDVYTAEIEHKMSKLGLGGPPGVSR